MQGKVRLAALLLILALVLAPAMMMSAQQGTVTLTFMINQNEFTQEERQAFMDANPGIIVETIPEDATRLKAMFAAGNPPDLIRIWESDLPELVTNGLVADLTDLVTTTEALSSENLAAAADGFVVDGRVYGVPKDWSPAFLYVNNTVFEQAGLDVPSADEALTFNEIVEMAEQLTQRDGDRIRSVGFAYDNIATDRDLQRVSMEAGISLFSEDFSSINLTGNEAAMTFMRLLYEMAEARTTFSALNPTTSWWGQDFLDGRVGMVVTGFWFQGMINSAEDAAVQPGDVTILPLPTLTGTRLNPLGGTVGIVISANTPHLQEAYQLFEFYSVGLPAENRAIAGWGVPVLNSLVPMLPNENTLQQQAIRMLESESQYMTVRYVTNPYITGNSINSILNSVMDRTLNGEITFEQAMELAEEEINMVIEDGMFAAGVR